MKKINLLIQCGMFLAFSASCFGVSEPASSPVPPLDTILERALERARQEGTNDQSFKTSYVFTHSRVLEFKNAKSELIKREEKMRTNNPVKLIILTQKPPSQTSADAKAKKIVDKSDFPMTLETLKHFEITFAGKDVIRGRPVLILDLKPAEKKSPEKSIKDRILNRAAGRIWLDEADSALVKADLHLTQGIKIVGGFVGALWKANCQLERQRTPDGLWYINKLDWHLEGREVVVHRIVDCHEERTSVTRSPRATGGQESKPKTEQQNHLLP